MRRLLIPLRGILAHPLGRSHPFACLWRFLSWQVRSRLHASIDVPFVNQSRLRVSRGMTGLTGNVYTGLHEFESMGFLLHCLRSNELVADVGANAGSYTVLAAKAIGCSVVAVEPVEEALRALRGNIALNEIADQVEIHEVVAADRSGSIRFTTALGAGNHVALETESAESTRSFPVRTLDEMLAGRTPALIKLDVEGYELKVLQGAGQTLSGSILQSLIVEINGSDKRYQMLASELVDLLTSYGFSGHRYDPLLRALHSVDPLTVDGNVIFLRNPERMRERLRSAPMFHLTDWRLAI